MRKYTTIKQKYKKNTFPEAKISDVVKKIFSDPNFKNKKSIWEQYDHMITRNVVSKIGGNASVIKTNYIILFQRKIRNFLVKRKRLTLPKYILKREIYGTIPNSMKN